MKRAFDFTAALVGLVVLSPAFAVIACAMKLSDRGPVFFRQKRVGLGGRAFEMLKFRSMVVNAESLGASITVGGDRRITPVGRLLRQTKLDELPQLWNVVRGDMSLVGPRPEVARYVDLYSPAQRAVLAVRPGITDPCSFALFDESDLLSRAADAERFYVEQLMPEKIRVNLEYAARAGFFTDLLLILATIGGMAGWRFDVLRWLRIAPLPRWQQ